MPKVTSANYSAIGTDFPVVTGTGNPLTKEDLFKLQAAVEEHTHDSTRGLAVRRVNTANAPASAGQIRVNADAFQWWNGSAVQTAASLTGAETLQNKSLLTPTIASFANATHNHQDNAGGSTLAAVALADGFTGSGAFVRAASPTLSGQLTLPVGSAGSPSLVFDSGNGIYSAGTDRLNFATAGVVRAEISASGNLGVGVTPTAGIGAAYQAIEIGGASILGAGTDRGSINYLTNSYFDGTDFRAVSTAAATRLLAGTGGFNFYTAPSVAAGAVQTLTQRLIITQAGNIEITPAMSLYLRGGAAGNVIVSPGGGVFQPESDNATSCGSVGARWTTVFATTGTINTSSREAKQDFRSFDPAEALRIVRETEFWRFRYKADQTYERVGFIAEDTDHTLSLDGKNSDPMTAAAVALAAVKGLSARVTALEAA